MATAAVRQFSNVVKQTTVEITNISKQATREVEQEEKRLAQTMIREARAAQAIRIRAERETARAHAQETRAKEREERRLAQAVIQLQRQRSSALVAAWKAEQREHARHVQEMVRAAQFAQRGGGLGGGFLAGAAGGLTALVGVSVVSEIRNAAAAWVDYSSKLETTRIAFTTMLGSAQAAEDHLKELQQFALKTPFQFAELIDASQRMQALGFNASQVIPILTDVGNAVAAAGGGSERLDRVVLAISQIQSKGKVATQELNQLAESGIGGFKILEQQLGKSRAELIKMVEAGEISSKVFLDAFQKFSQQNFGGLMEAQSRTFTGAMSNIKDALLQTSATAFAPLFKRLSETARHFSEASQKSDEFKKKLESVGSFATTVWDGAVKAVQVLKDAYALAFTAIIVQFEIFSAVIESVILRLKAYLLTTLAVIKVTQGDFVSAINLLTLAMRENDRANEAVLKGLQAEGKIVKELTRIYNDAAAAAKRLKDERAGVTVGVDTGGGFGQRVGVGTQGFSAGIFRKVEPTEPTETDKAKGVDPAATAQRLAELNQRFAELRIANAVAAQKVEEDNLKHSLERRTISFEEYALRVELIEKVRHQQTLQGFIKEKEALVLQEIAAENLRKSHQRDVQLLEIRNKTQELENKNAAETARHAKALRDIEDQRLAITEKITGFIKDQNEAILDVSDATSSWQKEVRGLIEELKKQGVELTETQLHWIRFNAVLGESKERMKDLIDIASQIDESILPRLKLPDPETLAGTQAAITEAQGIAARITAQIGPPPELSLWKQVLSELKAEMGSFANFIDTTVIGSVNAVAGALASGVAAWALYGESFGKAMKQALAAVLAKISAEATYQALIHAAYAIGSLAFGDFAGAAKHGIAAAKFAAVAAATGLGARAVAGGAFSAATGGGSGTSSSASKTAASQKPQSVDRDRRVSEPPIEHTLTFRVRGDAVVDEFIRDFDLNGRTRIKILSEVPA